MTIGKNRGNPTKHSPQKSTLELFINHIGLPLTTLRLIWSVSLNAVQARLRRPDKLTYNEILSLSAIIKLPPISIFWLIGQTERKQSFSDWQTEQLTAFVINYEMFYSVNTNLRLTDSKGREIDLNAIYLQLHSKYIERINKGIKSGSIHNNINRFDVINKQVNNYIAGLDNKVIFKPSDNTGDSMSFPMGPKLNK